MIFVGLMIENKPEDLIIIETTFKIIEEKKISLNLIKN